METDLLAQLIDRRLTVLSELRQLSVRQVEMIQTGDMARLLSLLAVKQQLLNELQRLESQLDRFRDQDPDRRVWRCDVDRQRCREMAARCESLLREIISAEHQCEVTLTRRRNETATLLQGCHDAAQARRAYGGSDFIPGSQFDMSCDT